MDQIVYREILCPKDRDDKKFNDTMAKSHRIDGLLEVVKNQLLFFSKPKSCIIIVTNGENNLSSNKKIELHHLLSKLSEELENYEVTFVHPAMH